MRYIGCVYVAVLSRRDLLLQRGRDDATLGVEFVARHWRYENGLGRIRRANEISTSFFPCFRCFAFFLPRLLIHRQRWRIAVRLLRTLHDAAGATHLEFEWPKVAAARLQTSRIERPVPPGRRHTYTSTSKHTPVHRTRASALIAISLHVTHITTAPSETPGPFP